MTDIIQSATPSPLVSPAVKQTTADDLLDMYDAETASANEEISSEVSKQAKVAEEVPKKILSNNLAKKLSDKDPESKDPTLTAQEKKFIKAKLNEEEINVPEEAEFIAKVNGKDVPVKFKDALKVVEVVEETNRKLDQRFSYLDSKEKAFQKEITGINDKFKTIAELAAQGDHVLAVRTLAEMAGKDPAEYEKSILDTLHKVVETYTKMTPAERAAYFLERKNQFLQGKLKKTEEDSTNYKEQSALDRQIDEKSSANGLTKEQFFKLYGQMVEGKLFEDPSAITVDDVITYNGHVQAAKRANDAIRQVNPKLLDDDEFNNEIIQLAFRSPEYSSDDLVTIINDAIGTSQSVENLNRKVQTANSKGQRAQSMKASPKKETKDEIDEELESFFFKNQSGKVR